MNFITLKRLLSAIVKLRLFQKPVDVHFKFCFSPLRFLCGFAFLAAEGGEKKLRDR
jgi:hypothetical protein